MAKTRKPKIVKEDWVQFELCKQLTDYLYSVSLKHKPKLGLKSSGFRALASKYSKRAYDSQGLARPSFEKLVRAYNELQSLIEVSKEQE